MPHTHRLIVLLVALLQACIIPDAMVDAYLDRDRDGERIALVGGTDCDDTNPRVGARASEVCGNAIDDDCDGVVDDQGLGDMAYWPDLDGDGWGDRDRPQRACVPPQDASLDGGDCDDADPHAHPNARENCLNGIDDDCDGTVDEPDFPPAWYPDGDGDGFGTELGSLLRSCLPVPDHSLESTDCDDTDPDVYPGAPEIWYDGISQACTPTSDFDRDGDGFLLDPARVSPDVPLLDPTYEPRGAPDCDDGDPDLHPGAEDVWYDGIDANCDGADDFDQDEDGDPRILDPSDPGYPGDCDDTDPLRARHRAEEPYNGVDEDCDGGDLVDVDGDGHAWAGAGGDDCDDLHDGVWASCGDCMDADGDGRWGNCDAATPAHPSDCDDTNPRAWESCDTCADLDGDGAWSGCDLSEGSDCDDSSPYRWASPCGACVDRDGDGYYVGCDATPPDAAGPEDDCDDDRHNAWVQCTTCPDEDGDGWGAGTCDGVTDCDDDERDMWAACATCLDADGDGSRLGCDQYRDRPYDCDDADPDVGGHVFEVMDDGLDQDCNGRDLTISEQDGLFVSTSGIDTPDCGTMTAPCATPGHAAPLAFDGGKVLFVAEGTYEGFETEVSVYGRFEDVGWTRTGGDTVITGHRYGWGISANGPVHVLDGLVVDVDGQATAVHARENTRVSNSEIRNAAVGICSGIRSEARTLQVERTLIRGCDTARRAVGAICEGGIDTRRRVSIFDSEIDMPGTPSRQVAIGIESTDCDISISSSLIQISGSSFSVGVLTSTDAPESAPVTGSIVVSDTTMLIGTLADGESHAVRGMAHAATTIMRSTLTSLADNYATSVSTFYPGEFQAPASMNVVSCYLSAQANHQGVGLQIAGSEAVNITNTTIVGNGGLSSASTLHQGGGELGIRNSILHSNEVALINESDLTLANNILDASCSLKHNPHVSCEVSTTEALNSCEWRTCIASSTNMVASVATVTDHLGRRRPAATSTAVDRGIPIFGPAENYRSIEGHFRPQGGAWDIGAFEQ